MVSMKTQLVYTGLAAIETEMLAVVAGDGQTAKGAGVKPEPVALTSDPAVTAAAATVLATGEFKGGANETLLSIERARRVLGFEPKFSWRSQTPS